MTFLSANYEYLQATLALKGELEKGFLVLAERLMKIRDDRLYEGNYDTFEDFILELDMSRSTCYKLIAVYEAFILKGELDPQEVATRGWGNLSLFSNKVKTKDDARRIFDQVATLSRTDALKLSHEMTTGIDMATCDHMWEEVCFKECIRCHDREKVYEPN